ncbi:MAG: alpha/beta fold hydrolase, partial [Mycobacterium sp.]
LVTKSPKAAVAATPISAVTTASSPRTPSTPSTPLVPDSATLAALGEEVQRKSTVTTQLSPGYLINSVINTVGAALAGTAAHLSSTLSNDVWQLTQFTRQMVGLGSDAGVVVTSLVNNIAALAANSVGRNLLWGLPYNALNAVATVAGDVSKILDGTPLNATSTGPFAVDYGVFNALGFLTPWVSPPGANDPSITVTAAHPLPIILINGTSATQDANWGVGAPALADAGYKVFTFNYGNNTSNPNFPIQAIGDIAKSAQQLSDEVNTVLAETGASQVILIGHSQGGGITPEYYLNNLGGASKVSQFIGIAPSNHGTTVSGLTALLSIPILGTLLKGLVAQGGAAWLEQALGSSMVQQVYGNGDTRPGVIYDTITSMNDEVVTPYTQQALNGPNVTNVIVQQQDPGFIAGHVGIVVNYGVWQDILGMLAANPAASPVQPLAAVA